MRSKKKSQLINFHQNPLWINRGRAPSSALIILRISSDKILVWKTLINRFQKKSYNSGKKRSRCPSAPWPWPVWLSSSLHHRCVGKKVNGTQCSCRLCQAPSLRAHHLMINFHHSRLLHISKQLESWFKSRERSYTKGVSVRLPKRMPINSKRSM